MSVTAQELLDAIAEGRLAAAKAKRVEFGDQAITSASADELAKLERAALKAQAAGDRARRPWAVARFGAGGRGGGCRW